MKSFVRVKFGKFEHPEKTPEIQIKIATDSINSNDG